MIFTSSGGRRGTHCAAAAAALLFLGGGVTLTLGLQGTDGPPQPLPVAVNSATSSANGTNTGPPTGRAARPARSSAGNQHPLQGDSRGQASTRPAPLLLAAAPVRLQVDSIGLTSTTFVPLHIQASGELSVPATAHQVGLYADGPTPGELGAAVLAAHVDTASGEHGIFYRLGAIRAGDRIRVTRADATTATFTVTKVAAYNKTRFPTAEVYQSEPGTAQLRLVTCGGPTDQANEYRDNTVVFATLTAKS